MPSLYVLDTDTGTLQQAGRPPVLQHLAGLPPDVVFTTVVTVDQATAAHELTDAYDRMLTTVRCFARIDVLPFTGAAAAVLQELHKQRIRIGAQDLRIAAIGLAAEGTLITANSRDFAKVPGLRIEEWSR